MKETSYVMVKPQFANHGSVIREVIKRLKSVGMEIVDSALIKYGKEEAKLHYAAHVNKPFYSELEEYITSDYVYGMVVRGEAAIATIRELVGSAKNPVPGTIRYDIPRGLGWELRISENVVHASDSVEAAKNEIEIYLSLVDQKRSEMCK